MAFKFVVLCAALACANAGYLGASIAAPALAYGAAPALAYGAAPALAYGAATPTLGSTFHGRLAAPAVAYSAAPALAYGAAAPTLGSTYHGRLATYGAAPALAYGAAAATLGSTYHGRYAAPAVSYASPALSYAAPAITSQHSNIIRSFGNLGQVSTYSKSIDTPFSSVRKADIRVSNPGLRTVAGPALAYGAAPAISSYHGIAAPAVSAYHGYAAPAISAYHGIAAPAISAYHGYAAPAIASPVLRTAVAAPVGVAYSTAPAVSHLNYASAYANYGW